MLLDSGASHNLIAVPLNAITKLTKFCNSIQNSLLCSAEPLKVHLAGNFSIIYHHILLLPLKLADGGVHPVELWVAPALNYAIIFYMTFLYKFSPTFVF